jgi:hypothetical protein
LSSTSGSRRPSEMDKKILKILLAPNGEKNRHVAASSSSDGIIAAELGEPLTAVRKRRRQLDKDFLEPTYFMNLVNLGYRRVDFLIATQRGLAVHIANELMKIKEVVRIGHSIGEPTIDLRAELIIKDNGELIERL